MDGNNPDMDGDSPDMDRNSPDMDGNSPDMDRNNPDRRVLKHHGMMPVSERAVNGKLSLSERVVGPTISAVREKITSMKKTTLLLAFVTISLSDVLQRKNLYVNGIYDQRWWHRSRAYCVMSLSMIGQHSWLTWTKCMVACNAIATQCYIWKVYVLMLSLVQRPVGFMRICDCQ